MTRRRRGKRAIRSHPTCASLTTGAGINQSARERGRGVIADSVLVQAFGCVLSALELSKIGNERDPIEIPSRSALHHSRRMNILRCTLHIRYARSYLHETVSTNSERGRWPGHTILRYARSNARVGYRVLCLDAKGFPWPKHRYFEHTLCLLRTYSGISEHGYQLQVTRSRHH